MIKRNMSVAVTCIASAMLATYCHGAVNVMASRDYVDRKTSVSVVTNDNVEGYRIGSNSNFTFATHAALTGLSNSIPGMIQEMAPAPGNYSVVSNSAMNSLQAPNGSVSVPVTFESSVFFSNPYVYFPNGLFFGGAEAYQLYDFGVYAGGASVQWPTNSGTFALVEDIDRRIASLPNYLTSFTEDDPLVGLTNGTIHIKGSSITPLTSFTETDPTVPAWAKVATPPYLTSFTETDPTVPDWAKVATPPYLTSYTETDPTVPSWAKVSTPPYLTSFTEEDPLVGLTNGTIYIRGETITPVTQATVEGTARQIIFSTSQYMWDEDDECLYMIRMKSGYTYQTPVTNVNALLPENSHILQYIENHKEEFLND